MRIIASCLLSFFLLGVSSVYSYDSDAFRYFRIPKDNSIFSLSAPARINDSGNVAFVHDEGIYIWNNQSIDFLYNTFASYNLNLNNSNDVSWGTNYLFDSFNVYFNNSLICHYTFPSMNNAGEMAFLGVYYWDTSQTTLITSFLGEGGYPVINDNSHIAWLDLYDNNIYVWDGQLNNKITNIADSNTQITGFDFNNLGQLSYITSNGELYFYDGDFHHIADNCNTNRFSVQMNDQGDIVWEGYDGQDTDIFLYHNGTTMQVTDNELYDFCPDINNNLEIVYTEHTSLNRSLIIATPVPEPSVVLLFLLGFGIFKINRKK